MNGVATDELLVTQVFSAKNITSLNPLLCDVRDGPEIRCSSSKSLDLICTKGDHSSPANPFGLQAETGEVGRAVCHMV